MCKPTKRLTVVLFALSALALFPVLLPAQTVTATLTGTVSDPSGGALPGVTIVAPNQGTHVDYSTESNASGVYTIAFLPIGSYVVSAEMTGFKKAVTNPITLEVNQTARLDVKLELGQISDTVSVTGVAPILQSETTVVGQVITGNRSEEHTSELQSLR